MCNDFICDKTMRCINEHICVINHCPYLFSKKGNGDPCNICLIQKGCMNRVKEK